MPRDEIEGRAEAALPRLN